VGSALPGVRMRSGGDDDGGRNGGVRSFKRGCALSTVRRGWRKDLSDFGGELAAGCRWHGSVLIGFALPSELGLWISPNPSMHHDRAVLSRIGNQVQCLFARLRLRRYGHQHRVQRASERIRDEAATAYGNVHRRRMRE
jgi:hypothetical protein